MQVAGFLVLVLLWLSMAWGQVLPSRSRSASVEVTFNRQIIRILQQNCQVCHHPGDIGPFSMMSYPEVLPWARKIKTETQVRRMPPWKPVPDYGGFLDERRLTQKQIDLIARWVDAGAPEGDPRDLPVPLEFSDRWTLGEPDLALELDADFTVPAGGSDIYRCFSIPLGLLENRYVTGFEIRPGNRSIVHHAILFEDATGISARLTPSDGKPGYNCFGGPGVPPTGAFGAWAPGVRPQLFPGGVGVLATAGARMVLQIHYHSGVTPQTDRTRVGLFLNRGPIRKEYLYFPLLNTDFVIPPGDPSYTVTASLTVPPLVRAQAISIAPHMHWLGRSIKVDAVYRDGSRRPLIFIDDWDFDWQGFYYFQEPVPLPPFTRLEMTAVYDNSEANPRNPNSPPKAVRWGEQTTDEMCLAIIGFVLE
ncbi:MAG: ascorbate-dependent monooxygenase [Acidobacteria bacterium]|nr:ascorbate-dependent monooxygenase [Acidobacteriota bacterium]